MMTEKTASRYLLNLEKHFANDNPVLLKAAKVFQDLDQIEYDLGLIEIDETTACKHSWWPIISLIGGNSTAKSRFINSYLGSEHLLSGIQTSGHKFTVLLHNSQATSATLPGTALDVDPRYPFYQISRKIEQLKEGEGSRINSYLELKTIHTERLKGKLFIDAPNISAAPTTPIMSLLTRHILENSDLVLVFTDAFESPTPLVNELIQTISAHQDSNKFVYIIDEPVAFLNPINSSELVSSWQKKLSELGLTTGQFIVLPNQQNAINRPNPLNFTEIDQRMANVSYDRTYRVLDALEKSIREIENVVVPEVKQGIALWKERANISSLLILGFIITLSLFAEINTGIVLSTVVDPILGPISILILVTIMIPVHVLIGRLQAKLIISKLIARQKELHLMENLANLFEKGLTFNRMLLPISEPVDWNKKTKARLAQLSDKTRELVQSLNDSFGTYNDQSYTGYSDTLNFKEHP